MSETPPESMAVTLKSDQVDAMVADVSKATVTAELDPTTSWRDWMPEGAPDPPLLSHDELIQELRNRGVEVTAATLEHWRRNGVVPRPVRRHHNGKTRPTYPSWIVPA
ncbi:MAG: hypothetical protein M3440_09005, partial [Chloroflexota bacterium]|nr:hypothetical protein [Chloroflexota bacterium]